MGFIEKASDGASRRNTTYVPSASGRAIVDAYVQYRRDTLVRLVGSMSGTQEALHQATSILHVITGLYDQASTILPARLARRRACGRKVEITSLIVELIM